MSGPFVLVAFMMAYVATVVIAMYWKEKHRGIECVECRDRRRLIRIGLIMCIGLMIIGEGAIHWPDIGFFALAAALEVS